MARRERKGGMGIKAREEVDAVGGRVDVVEVTVIRVVLSQGHRGQVKPGSECSAPKGRLAWGTGGDEDWLVVCWEAQVSNQHQRGFGRAQEEWGWFRKRKAADSTRCGRDPCQDTAGPST